MPEYEIRIRLAGTTEAYAQHVAWSAGRALDGYPHLQIELAPPRLVNPPGSTIEQLAAEGDRARDGAAVLRARADELDRTGVRVGLFAAAELRRAADVIDALAAKEAGR